MAEESFWWEFLWLLCTDEPRAFEEWCGARHALEEVRRDYDPGGKILHADLQHTGLGTQTAPFLWCIQPVLQAGARASGLMVWLFFTPLG